MGLPSTVTQTWTPTSADAEGTVVEIFVSVKRPVSKLGLTSSSTPLPLEVLIVVSKTLRVPTPPLKLPPVPMAQFSFVPAALKFPALWAKPELEIHKVIAAMNKTFFITIHPPAWNCAGLKIAGVQHV